MQDVLPGVSKESAVLVPCESGLPAGLPWQDGTGFGLSLRFLFNMKGLSCLKVHAFLAWGEFSSEPSRSGSPVACGLVNSSCSGPQSCPEGSSKVRPEAAWHDFMCGLARRHLARVGKAGLRTLFGRESLANAGAHCESLLISKDCELVGSLLLSSRTSSVTRGKAVLLRSMAAPEQVVGAAGRGTFADVVVGVQSSLYWASVAMCVGLPASDE